MGPLNLLGMVGFWGVAGRIFTLRQGKRLFGIIDIGQILGMFIISISIPFLMKFFHDTRYLLFFSAGSSLIAMFLQIIISSKFELETRVVKNIKTNKSTFFKQLKTTYVKSMSLYVILSMAAAFTVVYIFLPTAKTRYPGDTDYTSFLGYFTAVLMIFIILFKTVAYNKLTKTYGLKFNLALPPILLLMLVLGSTFAGLFLGFGEESKGFILFFIIASLSRLFSVSMKSSIEIPSQKILYQSLPNEVRHDVQVGVDGMVNEFAAISAGLLLVIMSMFSSVGKLHYNIVLILILALWTYVALRLYKNYRVSLSDALDRGKAESRKENIFADNPIPKEELILNNSLHFENTYSLLHGIIQQKFVHPEELVRIMEENDIYPNKEIIEELKESEIKLNKTILAEKDISNDDLLNLIQSTEIDKRIKAGRIIAQLAKSEHSSFLCLLLRDVYPQVRYVAIDAGINLKTKEVAQILIENLSEKRYCAAAYSSLKYFPDSILELIEQSYYKSGTDTDEKHLLLSLLKEVGGVKANKQLLSKLNSPQISIIANALKYLKENRYKPFNEEEKQPLLNLLDEIMGSTAWLVNTTNRLIETKASDKLIKAIIHKEKYYYSMLFDILAIIYDVDAMEHIREHVDEASEGSGFAVELLDLLIEENLKFKILPFFEEISRNERINRLKEFFPLQRFNLTETCSSILNASPNIVGTWSKVLAVQTLRDNDNFEISYDISAHLFNKELIIKEMVAQTIFNHSTDDFNSLLIRLPGEEQYVLRKAAKLDYMDSELIMNKLLLVTNIFGSEVSEEGLLDFCGDLKYKYYGHDENIIVQEPGIIIVAKGKIFNANNELKLYSPEFFEKNVELKITANSEILFLEGESLYVHVFLYSFLRNFILQKVNY
jgi:hypothetical protein